MPGQALPGVPEAGPATFPPIVLLPLMLVVAAAVVLVTIARRRFTPAHEAEIIESVPEAGLESPAEALLPGFLGPEPARDAHIPRWRRPSVAAARFETTNATIVRTAAAATIAPARLPLVFADATDPLAERMLVRYDSVPLLDGPDDVLGRILRELDGGDEVEVLERHDIWARVRTPAGVDGWVPTMTLTTASASAKEELAFGFQTELEPTTPPDEGPPLEALLEAIVAQRLARQELANGMEEEGAADVEPVVAPARTRARKKPADGAASPGASKQSRSRRAQSNRPAARPS